MFLELLSWLLDKFRRLFEPEATYGGIGNSYERDQDEKGSWQIDKNYHVHMIDEDARKATPEEVVQQASHYHSGDPDLVLGMDRAAQFILSHPDLKSAQGLKIVLYRILNLKDRAQRKANEMVLKQWYEGQV